MQDVEIVINDKTSNSYCIRGTVIVDGIRIPFTVYHLRFMSSLEDGLLVSFSRIALRSKGGILSKYKDGEQISRVIKDKARGWWIDNNHWR